MNQRILSLRFPKGIKQKASNDAACQEKILGLSLIPKRSLLFGQYTKNCPEENRKLQKIQP